MKTLRFDVFGKAVAVVQTAEGWHAFYASTDGKRRRATDIVIPAWLSEGDIKPYLDDLCHEWSSAKHPAVTRLG